MSQETPIGNLGGGISDEDSRLVDRILIIQVDIHNKVHISKVLHQNKLK